MTLFLSFLYQIFIILFRWLGPTIRILLLFLRSGEIYNNLEFINKFIKEIAAQIFGCKFLFILGIKNKYVIQLENEKSIFLQSYHLKELRNTILKEGRTL